MPELNPQQLEQYGDMIRENFDLNPTLIYVEKNPKAIEGELDVDVRFWYPLDPDYTPNFNANRDAYYVVAEWVNTWPLPW